MFYYSTSTIAEEFGVQLNIQPQHQDLHSQRDEDNFSPQVSFIFDLPNSHNFQLDDDNLIEERQEIYQQRENHLGQLYSSLNLILQNCIDPIILAGSFALGYFDENNKQEYIKVISLISLCLLGIINSLNISFQYLSYKQHKLEVQAHEQIFELDEQSRNNWRFKCATYLNCIPQHWSNSVFYLISASLFGYKIATSSNSKASIEFIMQQNLLLLFMTIRLTLGSIYIFDKNKEYLRKLLYYSFVSWPIYKAEYDANIQYNFDLGNNIQQCFAKDPIQNYLRFMIYTYEFILVLQILAYSSTYSSEISGNQQLSFYFASLYYFNIIFSILLYYCFYPLPQRLMKALKNQFITLYYFSFNSFIILQVISTLSQPKYSEYYFLQFEPVFAFYGSCLAIRITLKNLTCQTLIDEIKQGQTQMKKQQQQRDIEIIKKEESQRGAEVNKNEQNKQNDNNDNICELESQKQFGDFLELQKENQSNNIFNHKQDQLEQKSKQQHNSQKLSQKNLSHNEQISQQQELQYQQQQQQQFNDADNNMRQPQQQEQQINEIQGYIYFQNIRESIRQRMNENQNWLQRQILLVVDIECFSLTMVLSILLFVYMFSENIDIYLQNGIACNFYYFLSITSFVFYFLSSRKISFAYEKLYNPSDPLTLYWILPFQSTLNKIGWLLVWLQAIILICLYSQIDFTQNKFIKAEYLFMIVFSFTAFFVCKVMNTCKKFFLK